jgi:hypothetical protein
MRILLLLNGPRERYVGGADTARQIAWGAYCSPGTELTIGYLPSRGENGGAKVYEFGSKEALTLGPLGRDWGSGLAITHHSTECRDARPDPVSDCVSRQRIHASVCSAPA